MLNIIQELSMQLKMRDIQIEEIRFEIDPHGYPSICIYWELSAEATSNEQRRQLMAIVQNSAPYFQRYRALKRLMINLTINDAKVATEPVGFNRAEIVKWYSGLISYEYLVKQHIAYWHPPSDLLYWHPGMD